MALVNLGAFGKRTLFSEFFQIGCSLSVGACYIDLFPVLIDTLWNEERYGWLLFFGLFVLIPSFFIYFIIDSGTWYFALQFFPIGLFLF